MVEACLPYAVSQAQVHTWKRPEEKARCAAVAVLLNEVSAA